MSMYDAELMKFNSSAGRCVFSRKCVNLTQDELFSIFKSKHFLRVCRAWLPPRKVKDFHSSTYLSIVFQTFKFWFSSVHFPSYFITKSLCCFFVIFLHTFSQRFFQIFFHFLVKISILGRSFSLISFWKLSYKETAWHGKFT